MVPNCCWHDMDNGRRCKKAVLPRLCRGCKRKDQKAAFHSAQEGILYRTGELERWLRASQIFRQAVLNTVHETLYTVHLWRDKTPNETLQKCEQPNMHQETEGITLAWMSTSSRPASSRHVLVPVPAESSQLITAYCKLQGKMKYFLTSDYLIQLCTSSTVSLRTAKQLVKLSGKVGTN